MVILFSTKNLTVEVNGNDETRWIYKSGDISKAWRGFVRIHVDKRNKRWKPNAPRPNS